MKTIGTYFMTPDAAFKTGSSMQGMEDADVHILELRVHQSGSNQWRWKRGRFFRPPSSL